MKKLPKVLLIVFTMFIVTKTHSQISILSANFTTFNVTPSTMCDLQVMNQTASDLQVIIESKLYNSVNEELIHIKSNTITIRPGINSILKFNPNFNFAQYSTSQHAQYIKISKNLPSGKYRYCAVISSMSPEPAQDEYCDELEAENNNLLYLISIADKEEIETQFPILLWNHSEPFNLLAPNEFYRLLLVELQKDQAPEAAISVNQPIYLKNFLTTHSVQYPTDAKQLEPGKRYAWQVQKVSNGAIIDKTEAWEFSVKKNLPLTSQKYVYLKENLDASAYQCVDGHVYFSFKENYSGTNLNINLFNDKHQAVKLVNTINENKGQSANGIKTYGTNYCDLNLDESKLKPGIYFLEVSNEKGEVRKLKIKYER